MDTNCNSNDIDKHVDSQIYSCLNLDEPKSFFLFAGAGSGKTRSLVNVLKKVRENLKSRLLLQGQKLAIITYTNAACNEIKQRLEHDILFSVSTIHSFAWELIQSFQEDIRTWLDENLRKEIADIEVKQAKGRAGTKAAVDREKQLESKNKRLNNLSGIKRFSYNPNGDNRTRDSLNHSEVIKITAYFLSQKPLMQKILVRKYPILLIDESQDTNKLLIESNFEVQQQHSNCFSLGLFGDTMQRIYMDGKTDLQDSIPDEWEKPAKLMNHRCPKRVVTLINKIRSSVDGQQQRPRSDKADGFVRLFLVPSNCSDTIAKEQEISNQMARITGDTAWSSVESDVKVLTLEHHMAARRMGFVGLFSTLYRIDHLKTSLLDGSLPSLRFFTQLVLPLINAKKKSDEFAVSTVVRNDSPLLSDKVLKQSANQLEQIRLANESVNSLYALWKDGTEPSLVDVLQNIAKSRLFYIPDDLMPIAARTPEEQKKAEESLAQGHEDQNDQNGMIDIWDNALAVPFAQIEAYDAYVSDMSRFGTHQGVKGLEFPRVMVILDDEEAGGFLFSYEKLFGVAPLTSTDLNNERQGKDTTMNRTRRLFYVTCSRAQESLAIVAYTQDPDKVKSTVVSQGWFEEDEVVGEF